MLGRTDVRTRKQTIKHGIGAGWYRAVLSPEPVMAVLPPFFKENLGYDPNTHRSGPNLRQIEAQYARKNTLSIIRKEWGGTEQFCRPNP